jgi:sialidase-1
MILMKKLSIIFLFLPFLSLAQEKQVPVFTSGTDGYKSFRIPAIIKAPNGDLLAFAEGRVNGASDFGHIQIVEKRSSDNGKNWSALQVVASNDSLQADNAAPAVDMTDPAYPKGRIFFFYNTGNVSESNLRKGKGVREVWYKTSIDNGKTWSAPANITLQVNKPYQPGFNKSYNFKEDWRSYANTPGHAIQLSHGKYRGRIYVAANHSAGAPLPHYADGRAFGYYTDDHGKTFKISEDVNAPGSNEVMAVELPGNKLMLNARNQLGNVKRRIIAISHDGGQKWDTTYFDRNLPDPVCQGSILSLGKKAIAVCNDADTAKRNNLTVRMSYDEGKSWKINQNIAKAPDGYKGDYSAYSDLVELPGKQVGVLYEFDNYKEIVFTSVNW